MSQRRVVITGLGQVSPVGNDVATAWSNLLAGKSGIGRITRFDASDINSQIAGEVRDFDIGQYISAKEARRMDVFIHYGIAAALQAISDAGLDELFAPDSICLIEWPQQGGDFTPPADITITLTYTDKGRTCTFSAHTNQGRKSLESWSN